MSYSLYCLNYKNETRNRSMIDRFSKVGIGSNVHMFPGVSADEDPRIAGRNLIPHTRQCWSCMYGHLDMIRMFLQNPENKPYGIFCEDDILIDADFTNRIQFIIDDISKMGGMDTLLLGYLIGHNPVPHDISTNPALIKKSIFMDLKTSVPVSYHYLNYADDIWGTQMYMLSRQQAQRILDKYANGYADQPNASPPFSADWTITKEGKRCMVYPMLAIEDGLNYYEHLGQRAFHRASHDVHVGVSHYV